MADFNWTSLIQPALQFGGSMLGDAFQNRNSQAGINESRRQFDINQGNKQAVNAKTAQTAGMMSPTMLWALGYRDKDQIAKMQQQIATPPQQMGLSGGNGGGGYQPLGGGSKAGGIGAAAGAGLGTMIAPGVGTAIGAGLGSLAGKVGQGRKSADSFVQGVENPFGQQDLARVVKQRDAGDIEGAKQTFTAALAAYRDAVNKEMAAGGNRAKVAQQSMNNPQLQRTIQEIAQSIGVQI